MDDAMYEVDSGQAGKPTREGGGGTERVPCAYDNRMAPRTRLCNHQHPRQIGHKGHGKASNANRGGP